MQKLFCIILKNIPTKLSLDRQTTFTLIFHYPAKFSRSILPLIAKKFLSRFVEALRNKSNSNSLIEDRLIVSQSVSWRKTPRDDDPCDNSWYAEAMNNYFNSGTYVFFFFAFNERFRILTRRRRMKVFSIYCDKKKKVVKLVRNRLLNIWSLSP